MRFGVSQSELKEGEVQMRGEGRRERGEGFDLRRVRRRGGEGLENVKDVTWNIQGQSLLILS